MNKKLRYNQIMYTSDEVFYSSNEQCYNPSPVYLSGVIKPTYPLTLPSNQDISMSVLCTLWCQLPLTYLQNGHRSSSDLAFGGKVMPHVVHCTHGTLCVIAVADNFWFSFRSTLINNQFELSVYVANWCDIPGLLALVSDDRQLLMESKAWFMQLLCILGHIFRRKEPLVLADCVRQSQIVVQQFHCQINT